MTKEEIEKISKNIKASLKALRNKLIRYDEVEIPLGSWMILQLEEYYTRIDMKDKIIENTSLGNEEIEAAYKFLYKNEQVNNITEKSEHIKVDGHKGTWHTIESKKVNNQIYFLMEHDTYGDEAACIIVDSTGSIILEDIYNGFEDLEFHFKDFNANNIVPEFLLKDKSEYKVLEKSGCNRLLRRQFDGEIVIAKGWDGNEWLSGLYYGSRSESLDAAFKDWKDTYSKRDSYGYTITNHGRMASPKPLKK